MSMLGPQLLAPCSFAPVLQCIKFYRCREGEVEWEVEGDVEGEVEGDVEVEGVLDSLPAVLSRFLAKDLQTCARDEMHLQLHK